MKTSKTILNMAIGVLFATGTTMSIAQVQTDIVKLEGTTAIVPNAGNALERELTPALREQARKIAILENKKLDLEIEKVDLDIVKTQQESLTISNPIGAAFGNQMANMNIGLQGRANPLPAKVIDASNLENTPVSPSVLPYISNDKLSLPVSENIVKKENLSGEALDDSDKSIRVLMIGGNEDDLRAKIMHKKQGGYVVGKGDILPNGKKVVRVTSQFIEVVPPNKKNKSKIYVSGYPSESEEKALSSSGVNANLVEDSASSPPPSIPGMANAIPTPFGVPIAGVPIVNSPAPQQLLTPGQIR